jgi:hypothetical protein
MEYEFNSASIAIPAKDEWTILAYPYGINWDGEPNEWAFCMHEYFIIHEQFTNGTQYSLSYWYKELTGKTATHDSYMKIQFSKEDLGGQTSWKLMQISPKSMYAQIHGPKKHIYPDGSSSYWDTAWTFAIPAKTYHMKKLWLCPLWEKMWGGHPDIIYLKFEIM